MSEHSPEQAAAMEFLNATIDFLKDEKGIHLETAVAATARMAGTLMFRSFGFEVPDSKPGQPVLSEAANEKGPELVNTLGQLLAANGIQVDTTGLEADPGSEHEPHLSFLDTQPQLEPAYESIRQRHQLSYVDAAHAAAAATASLIIQGANVLDPAVSFNLAIYGFIEGAKTVPANI